MYPQGDLSLGLPVSDPSLDKYRFVPKMASSLKLSVKPNVWVSENTSKDDWSESLKTTIRKKKHCPSASRKEEQPYKGTTPC